MYSQTSSTLTAFCDRGSKEGNTHTHPEKSRSMSLGSLQYPHKFLLHGSYVDVALSLHLSSAKQIHYSLVLLRAVQPPIE